MSLAYAQDRWESEDDRDALADAIDTSLTDLVCAQRAYARGDDIERVLALVQEAIDRLVEVTSEHAA